MLYHGRSLRSQWLIHNWFVLNRCVNTLHINILQRFLYSHWLRWLNSASLWCLRARSLRFSAGPLWFVFRCDSFSNSCIWFQEWGVLSFHFLTDHWLQFIRKCIRETRPLGLTFLWRHWRLNLRARKDLFFVTSVRFIRHLLYSRNEILWWHLSCLGAHHYLLRSFHRNQIIYIPMLFRHNQFRGFRSFSSFMHSFCLF